MQTTIQPLLSTYLFWDTDKATLDYKKNAPYIIRRVFELGTVNDIGEVLVYYDKSEIIAALVSASSLKENAMYLASTILRVPLPNFKCYTSKPSRPSF